MCSILLMVYFYFVMFSICHYRHLIFIFSPTDGAVCSDSRKQEESFRVQSVTKENKTSLEKTKKEDFLSSVSPLTAGHWTLKFLLPVRILVYIYCRTRCCTVTVSVRTTGWKSLAGETQRTFQSAFLSRSRHSSTNLATVTFQ